jgi:hypothetical protein
MYEQTFLSKHQVTFRSTRHMRADSAKPFCRTPFSASEDMLLRSLVGQFGTRDWVNVASRIQDRTVRQCRERWNHYLCPTLMRGKWTDSEDDVLEKLVREQGRQWKAFECYFPGRTDIDIKNRYNLCMRRRKRDIRRALNLPIRTAKPKSLGGSSGARGQDDHKLPNPDAFLDLLGSGGDDEFTVLHDAEVWDWSDNPFA